ncbi:MAG TPA: hypothetical protein ENN29_06355 [Candidatus Hydrogenedentes bacterium]|nr:hypothetical protein [Candidatus Hydrogenedentota bacterium]
MCVMAKAAMTKQMRIIVALTGFLFPMMWRDVYAQQTRDMLQDAHCGEVRELVRATCIRQEVPANIMDVESLRPQGDYIVTRYSIVMSDTITPEQLFDAISRAAEAKGYLVRADHLSETRLLLTVSAEECPCVEIMCVLSEPLPAGFRTKIATVDTSGMEAAIAEAEKTLEQEYALPETPEIDEASTTDTSSVAVEQGRPDPVKEMPESFEDVPAPIETSEPVEKIPETLEAPIETIPEMPQTLEAPTETIEPVEEMPETLEAPTETIPEILETAEGKPALIDEDHIDTPPSESYDAPPPIVPAEKAESLESYTEPETYPPDIPSEGEMAHEGEDADAKAEMDLRPGNIAIILDDGGYGGAVTDRVLQLDNRITLAILPDTPFAASTVEAAMAKKFEIMLHMPMQTSNSSNIHTFPGELTLDMTKEQIQKRARECIDQFPDAVGVNNHTGAAFTMDKERIGWFLEIVKEYELFFVDSRTTWQSCAYDVAATMKIPCACRDIFLDNSSDPDEIRKYFNELIQRARTQGNAIGIGHFRPNTITVLEEELPKLKAIKIDLVRVSELVR